MDSKWTVRHELFEPVAALEVHQLVPYAAEGRNFAGCTLFPEGLGNEIHHGGERAEAVVLLDMELEGFCRFRAMSIRIPESCRSRFRADADQGFQSMPIKIPRSSRSRFRGHRDQDSELMPIRR
jgi:hypothetical protein